MLPTTTVTTAEPTTTVTTTEATTTVTTPTTPTTTVTTPTTPTTTVTTPTTPTTTVTTPTTPTTTVTTPTTPTTTVTTPTTTATTPTTTVTPTTQTTKTSLVTNSTILSTVISTSFSISPSQYQTTSLMLTTTATSGQLGSIVTTKVQETNAKVNTGSLTTASQTSSGSQSSASSQSSQGSQNSVGLQGSYSTATTKITNSLTTISQMTTVAPPSSSLTSSDTGASSLTGKSTSSSIDSDGKTTLKSVSSDSGSKPASDNLNAASSQSPTSDNQRVTKSPSNVGLELPSENLLNISYAATASHNWYFANNVINDAGSNNNFLIASLQNRYATDASLTSIFPTKDDVKYFSAVGTGKWPSQFTAGPAMFSTDSPSLSFPGNGQCLELFNISSDHRYNQICLRSPDDCEYGLSLALWFRYDEDVVRSKDILMSSGPQGGQGFEFSYQLGKLTVAVTGKMDSWSAAVDMNKYVGSWIIIGFSWTKSSGAIKILIGDKYLDSPTTKTNHNQNYLPASSVYVGCNKQFSGMVDINTTPKISISHVVMWMWPIKTKELMSSSIVYQMIKPIPKIPKVTTTAAPPKTFDFSSSINEIIGATNEPNPFYTTGDAMFSVANTNIGTANINVITSPRSGFQLKATDSKINLPKPANFVNNCPCIFTNCLSGLSMSFWFLIPSGAKDGDIFTIINSIRILYSDNSFKILIYNGASAVSGKMTSPLRLDLWHNLGFAVTLDMKTFDIYIDGMVDSLAKTYDVSLAPKQVLGTGVNPEDILIGGAGTDSLLNGVINDVVIWTRYLFPFEAHKFVGYTSSQFKQLSSATNYWTTDSYINYDSSYQLTFRSSPNGTLLTPFSLSTILKLITTTFALETDPFSKSKSQCPLLRGQPSDYLFLARSKIQRTSYMDSDINWKTICLSDLTKSICRYSGITVSLWLKILSVSFNKIQFFLSSGDLADYIGSSDGRGISIFVNQMLFGISLSTDTQDWDIILDSNRYKLNRWMNIGILWREDIGLQLIIDGVDHGLINKSPNQRYKPVDTGYRAVIGRFDSDDVDGWGSQTVWEFSNFVFGEMSYFESYMSPDQYSDMIDLVNNVYYIDATWLRQGASLVNFPIKDLIEAKSANQSLNYKKIVQWEEMRKAVKIISGQLPLPTNLTGCPGILSACSSGFSIGGWFLITNDLKNSLTSNYTLFIQGSLGTDGFGVQIINKNQLYGWVRISTSFWEIVVTTPHMTDNISDWIHVGLMWDKNAKIIVIVNGQSFVNMTLTTVTSMPVALPTLYIGDSQASVSPSSNFLVYNVVFYNSSQNTVQLHKMLGIQLNQVNLLSASTLFWTVHGLYYKLNRDRVKMSNIAYSNNRYDTYNASICTSGAFQSFAEFQAPVTHCLNQPNLCSAFILIMNIKLFPSTQTEGVLFLSGKQRQKYTGVTILQTSSDMLFFEIRNLTMTCITNITIARFKEWFQLQLVWNGNRGPIIKVNEIIQAMVNSATCNSETNQPSLNESISLGRDPNSMTTSNQVCISELMMINIAPGVDPDTSGQGLYDVSCYENMDLIFKLNNNAMDHHNISNGASTFSSAAINDNLGDTCLNNPDTCSNGLTMSFWVKVVAISSKDVVLVNIGRYTKKGLSIRLQMGADSNAFDLTVNLDTGTKQWNLKISSVIKVSKWTNIGVTWSSQAGLVLFLNGLLTQISTTSTSSSVSDSSLASNIEIGKQVTGMINDLVIWYGVVASCVNPQLASKVLNGHCKLDGTIPKQQKCNNLPNCKNVQGNLCFDQTASNIIQLTALPMVLTSPSESSSILNLVSNVLKKTESNINLTKAAVTLLTNVAKNMVIPDSLPSSTPLIDNFVTVNSEILSDKYMKDWQTMQKENIQSPPGVINETDNFYLRVADKLSAYCNVFSTVRPNLGVSLLKYNSENSSCPQIILPNYVDEAWKNYSKEGIGNSNLFTIPKSIVQEAQPVVTISSSIYNVRNVMPVTADVKIPPNLVVNSHILTINTLPTFNRSVGKNLVKVDLSFLNQNVRQGYFPPWDFMDLPNPDLKYQWTPAFWNYSLQSSNNSFGSWDTDGITLGRWNSTHTMFYSDHFTSFAVLMQPTASSNDYKNILSILTYAGLAISLISLIIFIVTIIASRDLRGTRYTIHLNMSIALFIGLLSFLLITPAQENQIFCRAIGILMHFFFIATFAWMVFEALFVFYIVTSGAISGRLMCFYPIGWGIPIIIVGVTAGLNIDAYGRNTYCWLTQTDYYIWAFLGPIMVLILATVLICLVVACNMTTPATKGELLDESLGNIKQTAFTIPFMLVAWVFGIIFMISSSIVISYIFVIFCCLQGFWVLLFFGLMNPDFRWALCCRKKEDRPTSAVNILNSIETEYTSEVSLKDKKVSQPPPKTTTPHYYVDVPKSRPPQHVGSIDYSQNSRTDSRRNLIIQSNEKEANDIETTTIQNYGLPESLSRSIPGTPQYIE